MTDVMGVMFGVQVDRFDFLQTTVKAAVVKCRVRDLACTSKKSASERWSYINGLSALMLALISK